MANKVHTINIGGKERTLKYTFTSFREFGKIAERVIARKGASWFEWVAVDNPEMWVAIVCHGLTHDIKDLSIDKVSLWLDDVVRDGFDIRTAALWPAQRAMGESGVCGRKWTIEDDGKFSWLDGEEAGKG